MNDIKFFLGAANSHGYVSYFADSYDPRGFGKYFILKGGPGTGKATFLRRAAEQVKKEGFTVHYVTCSADPDSLDAVLFPELNSGIFDGTAPHVMEPSFPGICEEIVNLGSCWDSSLLRKNGGRILDLCTQNSLLHKKAADFVLVASRFEKENLRLATRTLNCEKLERYIKRLCVREIGISSKGTGKLDRRFLSAVTPQGVITYTDTVSALAQKVIVINDEFSAVAPMVMSCVSKYALEQGYDVIACFCPLFPREKIDHIIIPELSLCFFTSNYYHQAPKDFGRQVLSRRFLDTEALSLKKERTDFNRKAKSELIAEAIQKLKSAKEIHDEIEKYYIQAMDFAAVGKLCEKTVSKILD